MENLNEIIVFEDENLLILNKPSGLLSQKDGTEEPSLEDYVEKYLGHNRAKLINRLDKDTTGLIVFGKTEETIKYFNEVFSDHNKVIKKYLAFVSGNVVESGVVDAPIRKNFQKKKMVVAPIKNGGKQAITLYEPLENFENFSLLEITLKTGRTHQIRVHMSYIRHHVIGDFKYGDYKINNYFRKEYGVNSQLLHSYKLLFINLAGKFSYLNNKEFQAGMPAIFSAIISSKISKK